MKRKARCCCGDVTLEAGGEPQRYGMCHCNNCKQRTGSAFGLSAYYKVEDVEYLSGESSCYQLTNPNDGSDQNRYFCSRCGSTVYWTVSSLPELIGIAGGCFTESPLDIPSYSVSHAERYSWVDVPPDVKIKP